MSEVSCCGLPGRHSPYRSWAPRTQATKQVFPSNQASCIRNYMSRGFQLPRLSAFPLLRNVVILCLEVSIPLPLPLPLYFDSFVQYRHDGLERAAVFCPQIWGRRSGILRKMLTWTLAGRDLID